MRLEGKVALITGGSRGIGSAIGRLFAQEGAKVAINYLTSEEGAKNVADEIHQLGGEAQVIKADVSMADQVKKMVQEVMDRFGTIDILVNNAGVWLKTTFLTSTEEIWDKTLNTNLKGAYLCAKEVAPIMLSKKKGRIINMSSVAGLAEKTAVSNTPYVVSKTGIIGLTRSLAVSLGPHVNVNAICPGVVESDMTLALPIEITRIQAEESILRRIGKPDEVARAALFLASGDSNFITGEILTVSGGRPIR
jgi:3-oxoacyl-[acyl-carrier protein] reductase